MLLSPLSPLLPSTNSLLIHTFASMPRCFCLWRRCPCENSFGPYSGAATRGRFHTAQKGHRHTLKNSPFARIALWNAVCCAHLHGPHTHAHSHTVRPHATTNRKTIERKNLPPNFTDRRVCVCRFFNALRGFCFFFSFSGHPH